MTLQDDRRTDGVPLTSTSGQAAEADDRGHPRPNLVDTKPPTRSKVAAILAALACAACCALPFLIAAGIFTGTGAAIASKGLLATSGLLIAAAGTMWWLHRRRAARKTTAADGGGCSSGNCAC